MNSTTTLRAAHRSYPSAVNLRGFRDVAASRRVMEEWLRNPD
jgi:hypothetical protein